MFQMLEFIRLEEAIEVIILIIVLAFIGGQMVRPHSETYRRARRIAAAVLLLYSGMGIYAWGLQSVTELLLIILRASLAAGVAFGLSLVTLAPAAFLIDSAKGLMPSKTRPKPAEAPKPMPPPAPAPRDFAAEERAEQERVSRIDDARTLVIQFYEEHAALLKEALPAALFKSQIHTRFPEHIMADQAWQAAQALIGEIVPLIAKAREQKRAEQEEERQRIEQTREDERKRKETEERGSAIQKLAEWYQREQEAIKQSMPEGLDQEEALRHLFERYDQLMRETLAEMKP